MTATDREEYLTVAEAAGFFKVSQATVWRWINQGTITADRIGRRGIRLRRQELASLVTPARKERAHEVRFAETAQDKLGPLTDTEQKAGLAALAKLRTLQEELLRERGGALFPSSAEELRRLRAERSQQRQ